MRRRILLFMTVSLCGLLIAQAQDDVRFRLGPQVGYFKSKDADAGKFMPGLVGRLKVSDVLGFEGSINYRQEEYRGGFITAKSWPVMVTGLLYVVPALYAGIGAGWYNTALEYDMSKLPPLFADASFTSETRQDFGWHLGGGLELPLDESHRSAFVADIRYVFLNYNFDQIPGSEVDANFYVISAGLHIGF